jgi:hypothetical protein
MNHPEARQWAEVFENKSISELQALSPPSGMHTHVVRHWQKARATAIAAREAPLTDARQTLVQQIAARADQLASAQQTAQPAANARSIAVSGTDEVSVADDAEDCFDEDATRLDSGDIESEAFAPDRMTHEEKGENLRERLAAAARNNEPVPEPVFRSLQAQAVLPRTSPLEAMEIQLASSASMVEGITRQFREEEFSASMVCEVMKSMAVLIAANAALGKVVYHFQDDPMGASGRGSNAF